MHQEINPIATHYLPSFISAPGQVDGLLVGIGVFLLIVVFLLGVGFLWLHSLPERLAHHGQKLQFEIVAVLCLLALFTHNNLLWGGGADPGDDRHSRPVHTADAHLGDVGTDGGRACA